MFFHMLALVLLSMVSTIFLLVKILQQPIRIFEISGFCSYHREQNACYHVKEHKKLYQKLVSKVTLHFVWSHLSKKQTVKEEFREKQMPYLDISYCLTVAMVSSIVLLQRVFTDETKKLRADIRT